MRWSLPIRQTIHPARLNQRHIREEEYAALLFIRKVLKMTTRKIIMILLAAVCLLPGASVTAEERSGNPTEGIQSFDKTYTLALEAISGEDYAKAKEYLHICFVYCDPQSSPDLYADLLLKQA